MPTSLHAFEKTTILRNYDFISRSSLSLYDKLAPGRRISVRLSTIFYRRVK